jgi:orotate phosphoribosyltransferase
MFEECRLKGDFILSSGKRSKYFYDFTLLSPLNMTHYCKELKRRIEDERLRFGCIVSPARGGIVPGWILADLFNIPLVVLEKDKTRSCYAGGQKLQDDKPVKYLIVDDVVSTYGTVDLVQYHVPGEAAGVASFIFRGESLRLDFPTMFLARKEIEK